jgi:hypothetical protein
MYIGRLLYGYSCQILVKFEFCRLIFEIYSHSNYIKICTVGAQFHADRHVEAESRFSEFCERAYKDMVVIALLSAQNYFTQYPLVSMMVCMTKRISVQAQNILSTLNWS